MSKTVKIISTLLIAALLVVTLSQVCFATNYSQIIANLGTEADNATVDTSKISGTAAKVVKAIRNIAAIAAVVILSILGIKYMMGSTQEKAEYKKSFIPLIVGIIVVVAATSIATFLFQVA